MVRYGSGSVRRRPRLDANQQELVAALRKAGATVHSLAAIGGGCPDLLVGWHGQTLLMEVKDGSLSPSRRKLTDDEENWRSAWSGGTVWVITSLQDALDAMQIAEGPM